MTDIGIPAVLYLLFYGKKTIMFSVVCNSMRNRRMIVLRYANIREGAMCQWHMFSRDRSGSA